MVFNGETIDDRVGGTTLDIDYKGSVECGIGLKLTAAEGEVSPNFIELRIGDPFVEYWRVNATVNPSMYFEMSSVPMNKFIQNVRTDTAVITSLLSKVVDGKSGWPVLQPGINQFLVYTDE